MYEFGEENLQRVDSEFRKDLLLCSRRRATTQGRSRNHAVVVITRREVGFIDIF
jgi:hypothetical protein